MSETSELAAAAMEATAEKWQQLAKEWERKNAVLAARVAELEKKLDVEIGLLMRRAWGAGYCRGRLGASDDQNEDVHWMEEDVQALLREEDEYMTPTEPDESEEG